MKYLKILSAGLLLGACQLASAASLTDIAGRQVELELPIERFVISEGRYVSTLAILQPDDPVRGLIGMLSPVRFTNPSFEEQLFEKFPHAQDIPLFGSNDENSVSVEKIIDLNPQVAIFGIQDHGPGSRNTELLVQLESAGIKVLFIDFRMDPLQNTVPSLQLIGKVLGEDENAKRYTDYYQRKLDYIRETAAQIEQKPKVFLQAHPGRMPCCRGMADGMLGPFISLVGGDNIADAIAPGPTSNHTAEFLLVEDPAVWIGTASGTADEFAAGKDPVAAGPGVSEDMAKQSLNAYLAEETFSALSAVQKGRAHIIWHNLYNSPLNIIAVEAFARWIHPETFQHIDPNATASEIHEKFLPFEANGVFTATADLP